MSALILVDIQYDFIDGSLAVKGAQEILPVVYELMEGRQWDIVVASQDYHPPGHISFASTHGLEPFQQIRIPHPITHKLTGDPKEVVRVPAAASEDKMSETGEETIYQMLWPDHCVQGTRGCEIEAGVRERLDKLGPKARVVQKGDHPLIDAYSAFSLNHYVRFTELAKVLYTAGITNVTIAGLATDYCVRATAIDARKFQFGVDVVRSAVRGVDPAKSEKALKELERWGCRLV